MNSDRNNWRNRWGHSEDERRFGDDGERQNWNRQRDYRGYSDEDYPQYRERYKRSEYPETYRSAASGYMSEHVGSDGGRRDYNANIGRGNLYGNKYSMHQTYQRDYQPGSERGFMSDDGYDRGTPRYGETSGYRNEYARRLDDKGQHRGKGPRNYKRADNRIQEDINDRLTDDSFVDASEVDVAVQNGEVTLTGTVDSREAKRRAEDIAESVAGVTHLENRIKVKSGANANQPLIVTPY